MSDLYVIVARPLHAAPDWDERKDWKPKGHAPSLEEAWAALDLYKERERDKLHGENHPHELEYDVWTVSKAEF
jgi:hypothetical protein